MPIEYLKSSKPHRLNKKEFKEYLENFVGCSDKEKELALKCLKKPYLKADGTVTAWGTLSETADTKKWVGSIGNNSL